MNNFKIECDTNCIDCKYYYSCVSEMKLEEETRDFWLSEREGKEEYNEYYED